VRSADESPIVVEDVADDTLPAPNPEGESDQPPVPPVSLKREYLTLLDKDRLVELLLSYDEDPIHAPQIFPDGDLQEATEALRSGQQPDKAALTEMPSYEDMIAQAIAEIADPEGTMPKVLFQWMDQCVGCCVAALVTNICLEIIPCRPTSDPLHHKPYNGRSSAVVWTSCHLGDTF
jgi:hypothetical protein